jgi:glucose-6-phosphate 1-dehydrogenase
VATKTRRRSKTTRKPAAKCQRPADALVIFGIRGDLATGIRLLVEAQRTDAAEPQAINLDMEFAEEGGEGPTPYEVLLHAAMIGDSRRFTRQDNIEETWRITLPLIEHPPKAHRYKPGSWGPRAADRLVADYGGWHEPWITS